MTNELQQLESRILLVSPSMSWWRGQYQVSTTSMTVGHQEVQADSVTSPRTRLLECCDYLKGWQKRFSDLDRERTKLVDTVSVRFSITGVRIVPVSAVPDLMTGLIGNVDSLGQPVRDNNAEKQSISFRLQEAASEFIDRYDEVIERLVENTPAAIWATVRHKIPNRVAMRRLFSLTCPAVRIASPDNNTLQVDGVDMANISTFFQQAALRQVEETVQQIVQEPRAELCEAIANLQSLISRDGRVTTKSFVPIKAARQKFDIFEFGTLADQPELASKLARLDRMLDNLIPSDINSTNSVNSGLDSLMTDTIQLLSNEQQQAAVTASVFRRIRRIT
jgi:hypothetical protein